MKQDKVKAENDDIKKYFQDRSLGHNGNTINVTNDFDCANEIITIDKFIQWLIKDDVLLVTKENASGKKILEDKSHFVLSITKPF